MGGTSGWVGTAVTVPTAPGIRSRYMVRTAADVEEPLKAFNRFVARHPDLGIEWEAATIRGWLLELQHKLMVREFDELIDAVWDGPVPVAPVEQACAEVAEGGDDDAY